MYFLREIMRTLLAVQNELGKEERIFLDRVFASLRFLGDDYMLRSRLIREFSDEVDILASRYIGKSIDASTKQTFTQHLYEDVRVGRCEAVYLLARCILHNNPTPLVNIPDWFDGTQLPASFVNTRHYDSGPHYEHLKSMSIMIYQMPLILEINDEEKKFLCLLLSRLFLIADPSRLRNEVVKCVDFEYLSNKYTTADPEIFAYDMRLGKMGQSEALLRLGWEIISVNQQRIFRNHKRAA